jgi:hypothetical protein
VNPRPRTVAVVAVGVALIVQTWLWIGLMDGPLGYAISGPVTIPPTEFLVGGVPGDLGGTGIIRIIAGPFHFEQDLPLAKGGAVHISEDVTPYSILLGGQPSHDKLLAALRTGEVGGGDRSRRARQRP